MHRLALFPIAVLSAFPSASAIAQDACVALANSIVFNQSRSFSLSEQRDIHRADLCSERYTSSGSSKSAKIEASFKFFGGGASGSASQIRQEQDRQCEGRFGDYWSLSISSNAARTASADSLNIVGECLRLQAAGIRPQMTMTNDGKVFSFSFEWRPNIGGTPLRLDYAGPAAALSDFQCSAQSDTGEFRPVRTAADVRTTVQPNGTFTLNCARSRADRVVDGESLACYEETLLSVATNGPNATLKVPEVCTPSMPGQRAAKIEARLGALEASQRTTTEELASLASLLEPLLSPAIAGENGCAMSGKLQICWGRANLTRDPAAKHTAPFSFAFARPFLAPPTVTNGINLNGRGHSAGIYKSDIGIQNYTGRINNMYLGKPIEGTIVMQYIAIGLPL